MPDKLARFEVSIFVTFSFFSFRYYLFIAFTFTIDAYTMFKYNVDPIVYFLNAGISIFVQLGKISMGNTFYIIRLEDLLSSNNFQELCKPY